MNDAIEIGKLNNAEHVDENGDTWTAKVEADFSDVAYIGFPIIWIRFYRNGRRQKKRLGDASNAGSCWKSEQALVEWFNDFTDGMSGDETIKALLTQHEYNRKNI